MMHQFIIPLQIRWSDLDPNFHLRHSVYYDWGALCRIQFLYRHQVTAELMTMMQFGPILFKEECVFRKEIRFGDEVTIDLQLTKARKDCSRWSIRHTIRRSDKEAAILVVDGAWLDIVKRKLTVPPANVAEAFHKMPFAKEFEWT